MEQPGPAQADEPLIPCLLANNALRANPSKAHDAQPQSFPGILAERAEHQTQLRLAIPSRLALR